MKMHSNMQRNDVRICTYHYKRGSFITLGQKHKLINMVGESIMALKVVVPCEPLMGSSFQPIEPLIPLLLWVH